MLARPGWYIPDEEGIGHHTKNVGAIELTTACKFLDIGALRMVSVMFRCPFRRNANPKRPKAKQWQKMVCKK